MADLSGPREFEVRPGLSAELDQTQVNVHVVVGPVARARVHAARTATSYDLSGLDVEYDAAENRLVIRQDPPPPERPNAFRLLSFKGRQTKVMTSNVSNEPGVTALVVDGRVLVPREGAIFVVVPEGTSTDVRSNVGYVDVRDVHGALDVEGFVGDITGTGFTSIEGDSSGGRLDVDGVTGSLRWHGGEGTVKATNVDVDELEISTDEGDIEVQGHAQHARIESEFGEVAFSGQMYSGAVSSQDGDVSVRGDLGAGVEASSGTGTATVDRVGPYTRGGEAGLVTDGRRPRALEHEHDTVPSLLDAAVAFAARRGFRSDDVQSDYARAIAMLRVDVAVRRERLLTVLAEYTEYEAAVLGDAEQDVDDGVTDDWLRVSDEALDELTARGLGEVLGDPEVVHPSLRERILAQGVRGPADVRLLRAVGLMRTLEIEGGSIGRPDPELLTEGERAMMNDVGRQQTLHAFVSRVISDAREIGGFDDPPGAARRSGVGPTPDHQGGGGAVVSDERAGATGRPNADESAVDRSVDDPTARSGDAVDAARSSAYEAAISDLAGSEPELHVRGEVDDVTVASALATEPSHVEIDVRDAVSDRPSTPQPGLGRF